jgi:SM-20-related protein
MTRNVQLALLVIVSWLTRSEAWLSTPTKTKHRCDRSFPDITWVLKSAPSTSTTATADPSLLPRLSSRHIQDLRVHHWCVIPNFIPQALQQDLVQDIRDLRGGGDNQPIDECPFQRAAIGQDAANALNTNIRVAETCFIGPSSKLEQQQQQQSATTGGRSARTTLYTILDTVRVDLQQQLHTPLDRSLTELLYAYYPQGGFYRRHRDAVTKSASVLRTYSLLLYLNRDWNTKVDRGALRLHFDSGGDERPATEEPSYRDIEPLGGTLVLFESDKIPHEVLDTNKERMVVVGWYNRPVSVTDITELSGGGNTKILILAVAAALVTAGVGILVA